MDASARAPPPFLPQDPCSGGFAPRVRSRRGQVAMLYTRRVVYDDFLNSGMRRAVGLLATTATAPNMAEVSVRRVYGGSQVGGVKIVPTHQIWSWELFALK